MKIEFTGYCLLFSLSCFGVQDAPLVCIRVIKFIIRAYYKAVFHSCKVTRQEVHCACADGVPDVISLLIIVSRPSGEITVIAISNYVDF